MSRRLHGHLHVAEHGPLIICPITVNRRVQLLPFYEIIVRQRLKENDPIYFGSLHKSGPVPDIGRSGRFLYPRAEFLFLVDFRVRQNHGLFVELFGEGGVLCLFDLPAAVVYVERMFEDLELGGLEGSIWVVISGGYRKDIMKVRDSKRKPVTNVFFKC